MVDSMLKADFHIHTSEDPIDTHIKYSARQLIDRCSRLGFEVLSITNHHSIYFNKDIEKYAKDKGILLIAGMEAIVDGKEVLIINPPKGFDKDKIKFSDLKKIKKESVIIAPHPFYPRKNCLKNDLIKHIKLFDGVEFSHFYYGLFSFNNRAKKVARKFKKSLIGTSDSHRFMQLNHTYTLLDCEKNVKSVLNAIRSGKTRVVTKSLPFKVFFKIGIDIIKALFLMTKQKFYKHG